MSDMDDPFADVAPLPRWSTRRPVTISTLGDDEPIVTVTAETAVLGTYLHIEQDIHWEAGPFWCEREITEDNFVRLTIYCRGRSAIAAQVQEIP